MGLLVEVGSGVTVGAGEGTGNVGMAVDGAGVVGVTEGLYVSVVGISLGAGDGNDVGARLVVGAYVGSADGAADGTAVVGFGDGVEEGLLVVGSAEGSLLIVGA